MIKNILNVLKLELKGKEVMSGNKALNKNKDIVLELLKNQANMSNCPDIPIDGKRIKSIHLIFYFKKGGKGHTINIGKKTDILGFLWQANIIIYRRIMWRFYVKVTYSFLYIKEPKLKILIYYK